MDIVSLLRIVIEHNDKIMGTLIALFIATAILLLWRSIGEKGGSAGGDASGVDMKSIEGAMRKVLASQSISVAAAPGGVSVAVDAGGGGVDEAQMAAMREAIAEREAKIAELQKALEEAKQVTASAESNGGGGVDPAQLAELKSKIEELQARLAEYEIIEDDIADLSLYKEENGRLKSEIEDLKKQLESAQSAPAAAPAAPKIASEGEAELKFEKAEKFELDPNDDIMKQFAAAVDEKKVDPTPAAFSLPQEEIDAMVRETAAVSTSADPATVPAPSAPAEAAPASAVDEDDAQAKIDAMFAAAASATPAPAVSEPAVEASAALDPQAEIDRMLAQAATEVEQISPAASDSGEVLVGSEEAEAEIDRMLAQAAADSASSEMKAFDNPQAMADALMAGGQDVQKQEEDPLASLLATDTEKMLSEVETLGNAPEQDENDALTEALDTEKLLAEVDSLGDGGDKQPEEDLLAEFKDAAKGGS